MSALLGMGGRLHVDASSEWFTPPHVFDALGLRFDLDVAAPIGGVPWLPAAKFYTADDDGLAQPWKGRVWLNPPYGREVGDWTDKLVRHGSGVALVFARTDARWAQRAILGADAVCLIAGRLQFVPGDRDGWVPQNAAAPSMLLGYGARCARAVLGCDLGITFT